MVVHVKKTAKKCTKKVDNGAKLLFYLLNLLGFFMFSLHLKKFLNQSVLPNQSVFLRNGAMGGG